LTKKKEYDFLVRTSFLSSAKLINDERAGHVIWGTLFKSLTVTPGATLTVRVNAKQENVLYTHSYLALSGFNGKEWRALRPTIELPLGSFDWMPHSMEIPIPSDIVAIRSLAGPLGGAGSPEAPGITWFDDLKIYQDDVLIYENKFTAPIVQVTVGGVLPIATGLGVVRFGKKGVE